MQTEKWGYVSSPADFVLFDLPELLRKLALKHARPEVPTCAAQRRQVLHR